ncbi:MAG: succinyl-CoA synthetase, beta subunit [uncultured Acidilobus sp. OSP8]|nr:MAG: succinyl-CoA synthetase, beta subunit [uncultured Acidilobus sp. OSP8]
MKLFEYEAKEIVRKYGFETPRGVIVKEGDDVRKAIESAGVKPPLVVKAQVLVAGRGKAGGVKLAKSVEEAVAIAQQMFRTPIKGIRPSILLIEEAIKHDVELYAGFIIDRAERRPLVLVSRYGGMDLEEIAREHPEAIIKYYIDPEKGLKSYEARLLGKQLGLSGKQLSSFESFLVTLYRVFIDYDAELAESNPLALLPDRVLPLDVRMTIDDNSLYRHPEFEATQKERLGELTEREIAARDKDLAYVELDGDVGIISNGAGLTMTTMDLVYEFGMRPANFLDIGGGAEAEQIKEALEFVMSDPKVKKVFINIFGGITRADEVARGIVMALKDLGDKTKPLVVRLTGTNEELGREILKEVGIEPYTDPLQALEHLRKL